MTIHLANPRRLAYGAVADVWTPPPPVDYEAWAVANIVFSERESPTFKGPFNPRNFPFFTEIYRALGPSDPCRIVTIKKSAQCGGTILANVFTLGSQALDPSDFLYCHPTEDNARRWSKIKLKQMLRGTTALADVFPEKSRDGADNILFKERADGRGAILISGANSPASLSQVTMPKQVQDVRAARDPSVKGVVIEADSFGGEVAGVFETADMLAALSRSKPTLAILTDHALSAAYLLASAARSIVIPKSGLAGSIGAIILHADMSGRLEKEGVKVTVLRAGKDKATMNAVEPLSKEKRESVEAQLESVRQDFAARVGQYRSGRFNANQALATEGAEFDGADAVALGLADAVGHANDAFDAFVREMSRA
ncbi:signal peptide peptidase SppA [Rhodoblastus acidophilus]|uniref:S49 family peptidase n=1 Tax=Rhodoblastus acidophilus TaxID=1074 RepID=UPI002225B099|nr:S49 family peptidase [Rhodoblastus acidophilus]MCW2319242.1 signal peptide peptidase SppA [Rhodoblastus acidophilus]